MYICRYVCMYGMYGCVRMYGCMYVYTQKKPTHTNSPDLSHKRTHTHTHTHTLTTQHTRRHNTHKFLEKCMNTHPG